MTFVTDKEELKTGLIIFRRGDVKHETWYCRLKLPKTDRYKTTSLLTTDVDEARVRAIEHEADIRLRLKYDIPVFTPSFREVARKYLQTQKARAQRGEVSEGRSNRIRAILEGVLDTYLGSTPVHLVGDASCAGYPAWRRENGAGRSKRNGIREVGFELAQALAVREAERRTKVRHTLGLRHLPQVEVKIPEDRMIPFVSDATIRFEMSIFRAVMRYAKSKGYVSASMHFDDGPKLKTVRREGFTWEEIDRLRTTAQSWMADAKKPSSLWYRTMAYHMVLIACDTGMRVAEMKNLRWRDVMRAKDREGRHLVVLFVQGKGRSRKLVAPTNVGDALEGIRFLSKAKDPDDRVFTNVKGGPAKTLYHSLVRELLKQANVRESRQGAVRSTYCFRHTYATQRLEAGVDLYLLAEQMGTSVQMIERHYGHVDLVKYADHLLKGMTAIRRGEQRTW